jgi:basic membrane protein A and related proteins
MEQFAPDAWLTAPVWNWGPYYLETSEQVLDGTGAPSSTTANMADGLVDLAPFGDSVSADTQALIEQRKQEIIDGEFESSPGR